MVLFTALHLFAKFIYIYIYILYNNKYFYFWYSKYILMQILCTFISKILNAGLSLLTEYFYIVVVVVLL